MPAIDALSYLHHYNLIIDLHNNLKIIIAGNIELPGFYKVQLAIQYLLWQVGRHFLMTAFVWHGFGFPPAKNIL
jgi:hypothetical protein